MTKRRGGEIERTQRVIRRTELMPAYGHKRIVERTTVVSLPRVHFIGDEPSADDPKKFRRK